MNVKLNWFACSFVMYVLVFNVFSFLLKIAGYPWPSFYTLDTIHSTCKLSLSKHCVFTHSHTLTYIVEKWREKQRQIQFDWVSCVVWMISIRSKYTNETNAEFTLHFVLVAHEWHISLVFVILILCTMTGAILK